MSIQPHGLSLPRLKAQAEASPQLSPLPGQLAPSPGLPSWQPWHLRVILDTTYPSPHTHSTESHSSYRPRTLTFVPFTHPPPLPSCHLYRGGGGFATAPLMTFPPPSILHSELQGLLQNGKLITWLPCLTFGWAAYPLPGRDSHRGAGRRFRMTPPPQLRSYRPLYLQGGVRAPPHGHHAPPAAYRLRQPVGVYKQTHPSHL